MLMCRGKGVGAAGEAENYSGEGRKEGIISGLKGTR